MQEAVSPSEAVLFTSVTLCYSKTKNIIIMDEKIRHTNGRTSDEYDDMVAKTIAYLEDLHTKSGNSITITPDFPTDHFEYQSNHDQFTKIARHMKQKKDIGAVAIEFLTLSIVPNCIFEKDYFNWKLFNEEKYLLHMAGLKYARFEAVLYKEKYNLENYLILNIDRRDFCELYNDLCDDVFMSNPGILKTHKDMPKVQKVMVPFGRIVTLKLQPIF